MSDLVLSSVQGYDARSVDVWIDSLRSVGYNDTVAVVVYKHTPPETTKFLESYEVEIITADSPTDHICTTRFGHYSMLLGSRYKTRERVLLTDIKDVVFQSNPFNDVNKYELQDCEIIVSGEGLAYKDEPWGRENFTAAFGQHTYELVKDREIINCGVFLGNVQYMQGLCQLVYKLALGVGRGVDSHHPGGGGYDQAALNFVLSTVGFSEAWISTTLAAQLGTTKDPNKIEGFRQKFVSGVVEPVMIDGVVCDGFTNEPFEIVHQYDRVPEWKEIIERKYRT